ncbi:MAG: AAA family ATPase [Clostridia bacterium]|nr:AAA family ATPase [Clostridia bacterium]
MKYSVTVQEVMQDAFAYIQREHLAYLTPEVALLSICSQPDFIAAYTACGGNTDLLREDLESYIRENIDKDSGEAPIVSAMMDFVLSYATKQAINSAQEELGLRHVVRAICAVQDCYAAYFLLRQGVELMELLQALSTLEQDDDDDDYYDNGSYPEKTEAASSDDISLYAPCLNDTLHNANPLIGREEELDRTMQILCRKDKNNPLEIGEPGVGKTAITYGLVERLRSGDVPEALRGSRVYMLDLGGMLAGTQFRGEFEKRFKKVLSEIAKDEKPIIYIDEIHNLAGAGAIGEGSMDASNLIKPYLSEGHIRFIGATTFDEYKRYFEKNKSLVRRFQNVEIQEPSEAETVRILEGLKPGYESYHGVRYAPDVLPYAVSMAKKHINERFLPDKAIDLIDEAGSYRKLHPADGPDALVVDKTLINQVLTGICRIPVETVDAEDLSSLATLENRMKQRIFGQDEAISQVVNAIKFSKAGLLQENKPLANLLFVGPTGVGKTEVARTLAQELGVKLLRFDMSEYEEKHTVAKLIGSPAGYVGYEDGGLLTEEVRKNPSAVLLLDEIEKAHPDIYNVLLQVMDYATLTDNQGRKADFSHITIIMTSNAGASRIGKGTMGFGSPSVGHGVLMEEVRRVFQPEFRNRLDKIVMFRSMDEDMARKIVGKKLGELISTLSQKNVHLTIDDSAEEKIRRTGISEQFGAREVDRVIRNEVKPLFVDEMLFGRLAGGGSIRLTVKDDAFRILFNND